MKLGLPYMGSKRKLSKKIVDTIILQNPKVKYVYDLFGGGGAISFELLKRKQIKKVVYNELNTGVVELLKDVLYNGVTEKYFQWVDRDVFLENKDKDDWFAGLCKTCWSFGSSQTSYLYGEDIEYSKKLLHNAVVHKNHDFLKEFENIHNIKIDKKVLNHKTIHGRRLSLQNLMTNRVFNSLESLSRIQSLERIEHFEKLSRLPKSSKLDISNKSYEDVEINTPVEETIIYLDPPYKDTGSYQLEIDYDKLNEYIQNSKYKIYISSYEFPFYEIAKFKHLSTLSATNNSKVVYEKLFCNIKESNNIIYSEKGESYKTVNIWNM